MKDLTLILEEKNLQPSQAKTLVDNFGDLFVNAHKIAAQSKAIKVTSEDQVEEMAKAKEMRLQLRDIRIEAEKAKTALKEPYLRGAQAAQDIYNDIRDITKPEEDRLKDQEKFAELREAERVEKRYSDRVTRLSKYVEDVSVYSLREMPDESFNTLLSECKKVYEDKIEAEKKAEEARLMEEKKAEIKRDRQLKIAPYSDFIEDEPDWDMSALNFTMLLKSLEKKKKERDEQQEKIRKENEKLQEQKKSAEEARAEAEEKLKKEKEDQERREREALEAKKAQEEAERKAEEKALLAPDKDKLIEFANRLETFVGAESPALKNKKSQVIRDEAEDLVKKAINLLTIKAKEL